MTTKSDYLGLVGLPLVAIFFIDPINQDIIKLRLIIFSSGLFCQIHYFT